MKRSNTVKMLLSLSAVLFMLLCGCDVKKTVPEVPLSTLEHVYTPAVTDDPDAAVTPAPTVPPVAESPVTFLDINFEAAVREAVGKQIGDIYPSDLQDLTSFSARVSGIMNIREISYFTSLEELDLMGNRISDLTPVTSLKKLKKLNIAKNFSVMTGDSEKGLDISPLGALPLLETLDASDNLITDVSSLGSMKKLKWLNIRTNRLTDLDGLEGCTSLEYLDVSGSYRIDRNNNSAGITDISALSSLTSLKTLNMQNGLVDSLEPIAGLDRLEYVDATYNALKTFPDMKQMKSLTTLIARSNNIYSLDGLANNLTLKKVDVRDNFITSVWQVISMPSLETIYLDGNPIIDYSPLDIIQAIKNLNSRADIY